VQVAPIKPTLKAPGSKRLKLNFYGPLSNFAFKFNLRRYTKAAGGEGGDSEGGDGAVEHAAAAVAAPTVRRCRLSLSSPR